MTNRMVRDIFAIIGFSTVMVIAMLLFVSLLLWLTNKFANYVTRNKCNHKWEFYDCGYTPDSFFIELKCRKCKQIECIKCDIDETKWDIEYKGED